METMATRTRAKTHGVRIRGVSFRCAPGSRRESILLNLKRQDGAMPHWIVAGCVTFAFILGFATGWWL
jgi:hypothetical protein